MRGTRATLSFDDAQTALAGLVGSRVSVRIVERTDPERLLAVFEGVLGSPSPEKSPSRFWPLEDGLGSRAREAERFGVVLHEEDFDGAESRIGGGILIIAQGHVLVNVRRLDPP